MKPLKCLTCVVILLTLLSACQHGPSRYRPTRINQAHRDMNVLPSAKIEKLSLKGIDWDQVVVLDTRPIFEGGLDPLPRSFSFQSKDWPVPLDSSPRFDEEVKQLQRRLALKGISPKTPVLLVFSDLENKEKAAQAQSLLWKLGVQRLATLDLAKFKKITKRKKNWALLENVSYWRKSYRKTKPLF